MNDAIYYLNRGAFPIGPVTRQSLEVLRARGVITDETLVRAGNHARWVSYSTWVSNYSTSDAFPQPRPEPTTGRSAADNRDGANGRKILTLMPGVAAALVGSHWSRLFHGTPVASALLTGLSVIAGFLIGTLLYVSVIAATNRAGARRGTAAIMASCGLSAFFLAILVVLGSASDQPTRSIPVAVAQAPTRVSASAASLLHANDAHPTSSGPLSASTVSRVLGMDNAAAASGIADAKNGDYKAAFLKLKPLADGGNATAAYNIGVMYEHGNGVTQNYSEAARWYRSAASAGVGMAQLNLGILYDTGKGVPHDYAEAAKWYRKAAVQGIATAQYNIGEMYATGQGVPRDETAYLAWMRKAADNGVARAQYNMGVAYTEGQSVAPDAALALAWYRKAAAQGLAIAQFNIGVMFAQGLGVTQDYSQAAAWYLMAAEQKYPPAETDLAALYLKGYGVPQDPMIGAALINLSAMTDNGPSNPAVQARIRIKHLLNRQQWAALEALTNQMRQGDLKAVINAERKAQ